MPLETGTYISDLVVNNPAASDPLSAADDHLRLLKSTLKATFPNITSAVTLTAPEINILKNGYVTSPDGTLSSPAWSFVSQPSLGIRRDPTYGNMQIVGGRLRGDGSCPAGALMDFAMSTPPDGWYACDGQSVLVSTDPELFAAIGYLYGGSGGTFVLPNLATGGRFRRHRDNGIYAGAVGTVKSSAVLTHSHSATGAAGPNDTDHAHTFSGTTVGMNAHRFHSHTTGGILGGSISGFSGGSPNSTPLSPSAIPISSEDLEHGHDFSGTTFGATGSHSHAISVSVSAAGDANEGRPNSMAVLTCIKR